MSRLLLTIGISETPRNAPLYLRNYYHKKRLCFDSLSALKSQIGRLFLSATQEAFSFKWEGSNFFREYVRQRFNTVCNQQPMQGFSDQLITASMKGSVLAA
jgi:hypothetical protein